MFLLLCEIAVMIALIIVGIKFGGAIGVGLFSLLGTVVMVVVFRLPPGNIPVVPIMIIFSIAISAGILEAARGLDLLVHWASQAIKKYPAAITFVAPLITFLFVFGVGTSNIVMSLEPVIARTALRARVRPERPLVASVLASNTALVASPAASSALTAVGFLSGHGFSMASYMAIVIPAALLSTLLTSLFLNFWGKPLDRDPVYLERVRTGIVKEMHDDAVTQRFSRTQYAAVIGFVSAIVCVMIVGLNYDTLGHALIPGAMRDVIVDHAVASKLTWMPATMMVQLMLYMSAVFTLVVTRIPVRSIFEAKVFTSCVTAMMSVLGPGLLGSTIFGDAGNMRALKTNLAPMVENAPWLVALLIAVLGMIVMSQTATISIMFPLALSVGMPAGFLAALVQAVNVQYVIPALPTLLFAEEIDVTGTTNKYRAWPAGLVSTISVCAIGVALWRLIG